MFNIRKNEKYSVVKNILNHLIKRDDFCELMDLCLFSRSGIYELVDIVGVAVWGESSSCELQDLYNFKNFSGIRFFYDYGNDEIISNDIEDISTDELSELVKEALVYYSPNHPDKKMEIEALSKRLNRPVQTSNR
ncbi:hypothetical protein KIH87_12960 [Paraneptunicella aestuarii]|uniref:hypothetical protein n=1 Tax=Paraneptunicella aestuarii TaxID=2831148 RepID=UPI001E47E2A6|nr:hypothetical protein [Paraneptunicella aestuarii]UAA37620.1 hypothetical protein KIH87_12960 [Paraneptunicella aestuarii]